EPGRARRRDDQRADGGEAGAAGGGRAGRAAGGVSGAPQATDLRGDDRRDVRTDCDVCRDTREVVEPKGGEMQRLDAQTQPGRTGGSNRPTCLYSTYSPLCVCASSLVCSARRVSPGVVSHL